MKLMNPASPLSFKWCRLFFGLALVSCLLSRDTVAAPCNYAVSLPVSSFVSAGGSSTATVSGCNGNWKASSSASWLTVSPSGANGPATLTYAAQQNTATTGRTATLTLDGQQFTITQAAAAPPVPTGLTATAVSSSQINLTWTASTGASGYKIYRAGVQIATTTGTTYANTGLAASTTYCYTVAAYDTAGNNSAQSVSKCATTSASADTTAPSVPSLTVSAASSSQINLSWTTSTDTGGSGLAGYKIYRSGTLLTTTSGTSYSNTGLAAGTSYCYTVAAYDNAGNNSAQSTSKCTTTTTTPDTTAPSVPTLTASAASSSQINLSWTASTDTGGSGLAGYKIYRSGTLLATTTGTSYSNTGLAASTAYCYTVAAYDNVGNNSAQSASQCATTTASGADTTPPSVPTLTVSAASSSQINLSWTASTDNAGGSGVRAYQVYRSGVFLATVTGTTYSDAGLSAGATYCYTVLAYDNAGNTSAQSASKCATTTSSGADTTPPSVPTLTATAASSSQINLSWTASTDNTGGSGLRAYQIYRSGVFLATSTTTTYSDAGLAAGTTYCYTVLAYDNAGNNSAQSASKCATTSGGSTLPSVPTGLTATAVSSSQINLSWNASTGATGYNIYRAGVLLTTTTTTSYQNISLSAGTQYCYTVAAYNSTGTSAQSTSQCATTAAASQIISTSTWVEPFGGTGTDTATVVAIDTAGNIYTSGSFSSTATFGSSTLTSAGARDIFITKTRSDGTILWAYRFGSTGDEFVKCMALDSSGNIYLGGYFTGTGGFGGATVASLGGNDSWVAKYTSSGTYLWSRTWGGTKQDVVNSIALDAHQQNLLVTGYFQDVVTFSPTTTLASINSDSDTFLGKYSTIDGSPVWIKTFPNVDADMGIAVMVDGADNVFLAGHFNMQINLGGGTLFTAGGSTAKDIYVAKFAASGATPPGAPIWAYNHGGVNVDMLVAGGLDKNGDLVLAGVFATQTTLGGATLLGTGYGGDIFIVKYSGASGAHVWSRALTCSGGGSPQSLQFDKLNNPIVCGYYFGTCNFGDRSFSSVNGSWDAFVAKYLSGSGLPVSGWAESFGGAGTDEFYGVAVDPADYPTVVGCFDGTTNIGGIPMTSAGFADALVLRLDP
jgi:fibronectin type 3 domain-containing protein